MRKVSFTQKSKKEKNKKKGFTLVELIIVIAVIAILAAMAIPKLSEVKKGAKISNDVAAAKNIHTIVAMMNANGDTDAEDGDTIKSDNPKIYKKLDGKIAKEEGKSEYSKDVFTAKISPTGDVTITCNDEELYPDSAGTGKGNYAAKDPV